MSDAPPPTDIDSAEFIAEPPYIRLEKFGNRVRNVAPTTELVLALGLCFGIPVIVSTILLFRQAQVVRLTDRVLIRQMILELVCIGTAALLLWCRGWSFHRIGLRFSWRGIIAGFPLALVDLILNIGSIVAIVYFYPSAEMHIQYVPQASTGLFLTFLFLNSFYEEMAVSGYVITALSSRGALISIGASAFIRLSYHLYYGPIAAITLLPMGILFAFVYWKWRNLWPLVSAHTLINIFLFFVIPSSQNA